MPLYRLLGGNDPKVPVYCSGGWTSYTEGELVDNVIVAKEKGFNFVKVKVGVKGGTDPLEDARRIHAVRKVVGPDMKNCNRCEQCLEGRHRNPFCKYGGRLRFGIF